MAILHCYVSSPEGIHPSLTQLISSPEAWKNSLPPSPSQAEAFRNQAPWALAALGEVDEIQ